MQSEIAEEKKRRKRRGFVLSLQEPLRFIGRLGGFSPTPCDHVLIELLRKRWSVVKRMRGVGAWMASSFGPQNFGP